MAAISSKKKRQRDEESLSSSLHSIETIPKDDILRGQKLLTRLRRSPKHNSELEEEALHYRGYYVYMMDTSFACERLLGPSIQQLKHPQEARNLAREYLHSVALQEATKNNNNNNMHQALLVLLKMADMEVTRSNTRSFPPPFKYRIKNTSSASEEERGGIIHQQDNTSGIASSSFSNDYYCEDNNSSMKKIVELDLFVSGSSSSDKVDDEMDEQHSCSSTSSLSSVLCLMKPLCVMSRQTSAVLVTTGVQIQKWGHINDMDNYFNFLRCILCFLEDHPVFQKNPSGSGNVSLLYASFDAWAKANILEARTQAELALKQNLKAELALANERLIALMQEVILLESSPLNVANQEAFEKWQSAHQTLDAFQRDMASLFLFFLSFLFFLNF